MKKFWLISLCSAGLLIAANAQEGTPGTQIATADNMPTTVTESADNQLQDIIDKCGLQDAAAANKLIFSTATAGIGKKPSDSDYVEAVGIAFEEAINAAKRSMAASLTAKVSREVEDTLIKGPNAKPSGGSPASQAVLEALQKKIKEKLIAEGVDMNNPNAIRAAVGKIKRSKEFKDSIKAAGECFLTGCQVFKTVATEKQVGVALVHNDRLMRLAESMFSNIQIESKGQGGTPLRSQLPTDNLGLVNSYGIRLARDEKGDDWLLCYTQAAIEDIEDSQDAFDETEIIAAGQYRSFAGEKFAYSRALNRSKSTVELEKMGKSTSIAKDMKQESKAIADELEINGILLIYKKVVKLASGHHMAVAVYKWNPAGSAKAQKDLQKMNATSKNKRQSGNYNMQSQSSFQPPARKQYNNVRHVGEGATGLID